MTARELIEKLEAYPPYMEVNICAPEMSGIADIDAVEEYHDYVLLSSEY